MNKVKILGAGSIGSHLSHASRSLGWQVDLCDVDPTALARTRNDIYPARYGKWDEAIRLFECKDVPRGSYDLICIGTPPDSHVSLALKAILENPRAILVEKPFCTPDLNGAQELFDLARNNGVAVFTGYDHVVGKAARQAEVLIRSGVIGQVQTIDVEFREHWGGIFNAHPWLSGPEDSYLGYWERGGGASGEHSHAINLWQHFAHVSGAGRVVEVSAMLNYVKRGKSIYDDLCLLNLRTENGLVGRVVQDVVTRPHRKRARVQGTEGAVEWINGYSQDCDAVLCLMPGRDEEVHLIPKKRPDDFVEELKHLQAQIDHPGEPSGISLERGLDTMLVVAAAHGAARSQSQMQIDYSRGYKLDALRPLKFSS